MWRKCTLVLQFTVIPSDFVANAPSPEVCLHCGRRYLVKYASVPAMLIAEDPSRLIRQGDPVVAAGLRAVP
jgi:hypothetical protein